jgi:hypothetical protein
MWSGAQIDNGPIIAYAVAFFIVLAPPILAIVGGVSIFAALTMVIMGLVKQWRN